MHTDPERKSISSRLEANSLVQAWLVVVLAVGFGLSLAAVQLVLGPVIERNKVNETLEQVPALVLGRDLAAKMEAEHQTLEVTSQQVTVERPQQKKYYRVYEARYQGGLRGWVVKTRGQGYADVIELLIGLSPDLKTITGLFVLGQKETPGLGNKIIAETWRGQFVGIPALKPLRVVKTGASQPGEIEAITGATISSRSVAAMINTAVGDLRQPLTATPLPAKKKGAANG